MSERDFTLGGREFKLSKLDALKQFHIVRRIGPILSDVIPVMKKLSDLKESTLSEDDKFKAIADFAKPVMNGLSKLSDEDAEKVLMGLLESVEMKQEKIGNWARIARNGSMMFNDIDFQTLMGVAGRAFGYNLGGFLATAHPASQDMR